MRRWFPLAILFTLAVTVPTGPAAAGGNHPPTAAAGLDQSVPVGTTVYLDAGGSSDPDGEITATEWSIRAPNGSTLVPSCEECTTPTFTPDATGRWAVTVTVTDDDGATDSDTLYVSVGEPRGPDLSVQVPETTPSSTVTHISVEAVADDTPLQRVEVFHDDTRVEQFSVSGDDTTVTTSITFESTGPAELLAVATDEQGYVTTQTMTVEVVETTSDRGATNPASTGDSGGSNSGSTGTTSSVGGRGSDRCRAARIDGDIRTLGSCDEDEDEFVHVLDDAGNVVGRQLVDTSGDGELTMTVRNSALDGGSKTVTVGAHVDRSEYTVDTGNHVLAVDYDAVDSKVGQVVVKKATADNNNDDSRSNVKDEGGSGTEPNDTSTEPTEPNYGGGNGNSDPPSSSPSSDTSEVNMGSSFSPSNPADRTDPSSSSGGDSGDSSNDDSGSGPSYSPSNPADRTNPSTSSGGDSSSSGSSHDDSSSTSGGTSDANTGTSFSPSPGDRSSLPTGSSSTSGGDSGRSSTNDSSSSSSSGSTDMSSSSSDTYSPPNGVNRYDSPSSDSGSSSSSSGSGSSSSSNDSGSSTAPSPSGNCTAMEIYMDTC